MRGDHSAAGAIVALVAVLCLVAASNSSGSTRLSAQGRVILLENCGRCHAIDAIGDSPVKIAPPMREIYSRFVPREFQQELLEGMVSRHKEMPQIEFSQQDVAAIMAYLYELTTRQ